MYFQHDTHIWRDYPSLAAGLLVVAGVHAGVDAEPLLPPWFDRARQRLSQSSEGEMPSIAAWRRAFSQMGFKPTQYRSAAEALLRRFRREDEIPRLHPLVDLCNALSLAFALPIAVFDLHSIDDYIEVRYARGDESYLAFNSEVENPAPGEIIFVDAADRVHARRWTFRQSLYSVIRPETQRALIVCEGLHDEANGDIADLLDALQKGISTLWAPPMRRAMLTATASILEFP